MSHWSKDERIDRLSDDVCAMPLDEIYDELVKAHSFPPEKVKDLSEYDAIDLLITKRYEADELWADA